MTYMYIIAMQQNRRGFVSSSHRRKQGKGAVLFSVTVITGKIGHLFKKRVPPKMIQKAKLARDQPEMTHIAKQQKRREFVSPACRRNQGKDTLPVTVQEKTGRMDHFFAWLEKIPDTKGDILSSPCSKMAANSSGFQSVNKDDVSNQSGDKSLKTNRLINPATADSDDGIFRTIDTVVDQRQSNCVFDDINNDGVSQGRFVDPNVSLKSKSFGIANENLDMTDVKIIADNESQDELMKFLNTFDENRSFSGVEKVCSKAFYEKVEAEVVPISLYWDENPLSFEGEDFCENNLQDTSSNEQDIGKSTIPDPAIYNKHDNTELKTEVKSTPCETVGPQQTYTSTISFNSGYPEFVSYYNEQTLMEESISLSSEASSDGWLIVDRNISLIPSRYLTEDPSTIKLPQPRLLWFSKCANTVKETHLECGHLDVTALKRSRNAEKDRKIPECDGSLPIIDESYSSRPYSDTPSNDSGSALRDEDTHTEPKFRPQDILNEHVPSGVPSPELRPDGCGAHIDLIKFDSNPDYRVVDTIFASICEEEKSQLQTPLCQMPKSQLLQLAAQFLPTADDIGGSGKGQTAFRPDGFGAHIDLIKFYSNPGIDRPPTEKELSHIATKTGFGFAILGAELGIPSVTIEQIRTDNQNCVEQVRQMLLKWKQRNGQCATLKTLLEIILNCDAVNVDLDDILEDLGISRGHLQQNGLVNAISQHYQLEDLKNVQDKSYLCNNDFSSHNDSGYSHSNIYEDETELNGSKTCSSEPKDETTQESRDTCSSEPRDETTLDSRDKCSSETKDGTTLDTNDKWSSEPKDLTTLDSMDKCSIEPKEETTLDSRDKSCSSEPKDETTLDLRFKCSSEPIDITNLYSRDKFSSEPKDEIILDSIDRCSSEPKDETTMDSMDHCSSEVKNETTLDSREKCSSEPKDETTLDSRDKCSSEPKDETILDSRNKCPSGPKDETTLDSRDKCSSESKGEKILDSRDKWSSEPKDETTLDSSDKCSSEPKEEPTLDSRDKCSSEPKDETTLDSIGKCSSESKDKTLLYGVDTCSCKLKDEAAVVRSDKFSSQPIFLSQPKDKTSLDGNDTFLCKCEDETLLGGSNTRASQWKDKTTLDSRDTCSSKPKDKSRLDEPDSVICLSNSGGETHPYVSDSCSNKCKDETCKDKSKCDACSSLIQFNDSDNATEHLTMLNRTVRETIESEGKAEDDCLCTVGKSWKDCNKFKSQNDSGDVKHFCNVKYAVQQYDSECFSCTSEAVREVQEELGSLKESVASISQQQHDLARIANETQHATTLIAQSIFDIQKWMKRILSVQLNNAIVDSHKVSKEEDPNVMIEPDCSIPRETSETDRDFVPMCRRTSTDSFLNKQHCSLKDTSCSNKPIFWTSWKTKKSSNISLEKQERKQRNRRKRARRLRAPQQNSVRQELNSDCFTSQSSTETDSWLSYRRVLREHCEKTAQRHIARAVAQRLYIEHAHQLHGTVDVYGLRSFFNRVNTGTPLTHEEQMQFEWLRFITFSQYEGEGNGIGLARNGFYHCPELGPNATRCFACDIVHEEWTLLDNVEQTHQRLSPSCPLLRNNSGEGTRRNISIAADDGPQRAASTANVNVRDASATGVSQSPAATSTSQPTPSSSISQPTPSGSIFPHGRSPANFNHPPTPETIRQLDAAAAARRNALSASNTQNPVSPLTERLSHAQITESEEGPRSILAQPTEDPENRQAHIHRAGYSDQDRSVSGIRPSDMFGGGPVGHGAFAAQSLPVTTPQSSQPLRSSSAPLTNLPLTTETVTRSSSSATIAGSTQTTTTPPQQTAVIQPSETEPRRANVALQRSSTPLKTVSAVLERSSQPRGPDDPRLNVDLTTGIYIERPRHPEYNNLQTRIDTFTDWPAHLDQDTRQLAELGFFHVGVADFVRCFACGGGLRNWERGDNPLVEHIRWFPNCEYMRKLKGQHIIDLVLRHVREQEAAEGAAASRTYLNTTDPLQSELGRSLIDMGFTEDQVKDGITGARQRLGRTDVTANEVIDWLDANRPPSAAETKTQLRVVVRQEDTTTTSTTTTTSSSSRSANTLTTSHSQVNVEVAVAGANITATATTATSMTAGGNNDDDEEYETPPEGNTSGQAKNGGKKKKKRKSKGGNAASKSSNEGATAQQTENLDPAAIQKENERLRDMQTCKICMERPVDTTLLPCGHLVTCNVCAQRLAKCPICRKKKEGAVRTFMS